mmetsp:Transcript_20126/g.55566  ORF Transcript_20126/g.55566 Transcript_20126/m.55566 type:complete len:119 (+) Transcript_20126:522-878(+)
MTTFRKPASDPPTLSSHHAGSNYSPTEIQSTPPPRKFHQTDPLSLPSASMHQPCSTRKQTMFCRHIRFDTFFFAYNCDWNILTLFVHFLRAKLVLVEETTYVVGVLMKQHEEFNALAS